MKGGIRTHNQDMLSDGLVQVKIFSDRWKTTDLSEGFI